MCYWELGAHHWEHDGNTRNLKFHPSPPPKEKNDQSSHWLHAHSFPRQGCHQFFFALPNTPCTKDTIPIEVHWRCL